MKKLTGYVYFIGSIKDGFVKIGMTRGDDPTSRVSAIQTGCPHNIYLIGYIECREIEPIIVEQDLHNVFKIYRRNNEWFNISGFLASFMADYFSGKEKEITVFPSNGNAKKTWSIMCEKNSPIERAVKKQKTDGDLMSVIYGLECMLSDVMLRNAKLEVAIDAIKQLDTKKDEIISSLETITSSPDAMITDLIIRNYSESAKIDAAQMLSYDFDWDSFFGNGQLHNETPDEYKRFKNGGRL